MTESLLLRLRKTVHFRYQFLRKVLVIRMTNHPLYSPPPLPPDAFYLLPLQTYPINAIKRFHTPLCTFFHHTQPFPQQLLSVFAYLVFSATALRHMSLLEETSKINTCTVLVKTLLRYFCKSNINVINSIASSRNISKVLKNVTLHKIRKAVRVFFTEYGQFICVLSLFWNGAEPSKMNVINRM